MNDHTAEGRLNHLGREEQTVFFLGRLFSINLADGRFEEKNDRGGVTPRLFDMRSTVFDSRVD
jgi:hypothetical protein